MDAIAIPRFPGVKTLGLHREGGVEISGTPWHCVAFVRRFQSLMLWALCQGDPRRMFDGGDLLCWFGDWSLQRKCFDDARMMRGAWKSNSVVRQEGQLPNV